MFFDRLALPFDVPRPLGVDVSMFFDRSTPPLPLNDDADDTDTAPRMLLRGGPESLGAKPEVAAHIRRR